MEIIKIILTVSLTVNIFLIGVVLLLWFRKCKNCGDDKDIGNIFNSACHRCNKKNGKKSTNF